jgi:hypothetical protein
VLGKPFHTESYGVEAGRSHAETVPGMAHFVDVYSLHTCSQCGHWLPIKGKEGIGNCALFQRLARGRRGAKPKPLRASQRACTKWSSNLGASR